MIDACQSEGGRGVSSSPWGRDLLRRRPAQRISGIGQRLTRNRFVNLLPGVFAACSAL